MVTGQSSAGNASPHQRRSDLGTGAGAKRLLIDSASAGLLNYSYMINLISVTCTIYGKQMRDFTCCSDLYIHQERTRPINKIVWKTFTAVILIMHFKSWGYQKRGFFFSPYCLTAEIKQILLKYKANRRFTMCVISTIHIRKQKI